MKRSGLNYVLLYIKYKKKNRTDANRPGPARRPPLGRVGTIKTDPKGSHKICFCNIQWMHIWYKYLTLFLST